MVNKFINSIADKLYSTYPTYEIYTEEIKQGLKEPCFFISIIDSNIKKGLNKRRELTVKFDIICFLDTESENSEYWDVNNVLNEVLELLTVEDKVYRTINKKGELLNNALHFKLDIIAGLFESKAQETKINTITLNESFKE